MARVRAARCDCEQPRQEHAQSNLRHLGDRPSGAGLPNRIIACEIGVGSRHRGGYSHQIEARASLGKWVDWKKAASNRLVKQYNRRYPNGQEDRERKQNLSPLRPHHLQLLFAGNHHPGETSGPKPDGTVVPCAVAGLLPFDPDCLLTLQNMRNTYGSRIWGQYGFVDALNPMTGWTASDVLGIDVGITGIMAENQRSGAVWKWFMANPEADSAMRRAGFNPSPLKPGSRTSLLATLATVQPLAIK